MSFPLLLAGIVAIVGFALHLVMGEHAVMRFRPSSQDREERRWRGWLQVRAGWHLGSFQLLAVAVFLLFAGFGDLIVGEKVLVTWVGFYFFASGLVWLGLLAWSDRGLRQASRLFEWAFHIGIGGCCFLGA
ncbi:MAG: hypothetical protein AAF555_02275 [Verrucomicrobiota bacterium]